MPVIAAALFGSRARGDSDPSSDTDILFITSDKSPHHMVKNNLSISAYPKDYLISKAKNGDLFLCHIVNEGKVLYDDHKNFDDIVNSFSYRADYNYELKCATQLGLFLYHYGREFSSPVEVNRKIAWCVRTILIAKSAEIRKPVFSPAALSNFSQSSEVLTLIQHKSSTKLSNYITELFCDFLYKWGCKNMPREKLPPKSYYKLFEMSENKVAMSIFNRAWLEVDPNYL